MGVSTCGSVSTTGCSELIGSHVGSSSDGFTGTALVAGHHATDAWLKTRHGGGRGAGSHGGALTDGLDCRCSAVLTRLLKACISFNVVLLAVGSMVSLQQVLLIFLVAQVVVGTRSPC